MLKKFFLLNIMMFWSLSCFAHTLSEDMAVEVGVFDAATINLNYENSIKNYHISTTVKTQNLFNTLYPFYGKYESHGYYIGSKLIPSIYQTYTQSRNHIRSKKILYDTKGKAYRRISTRDTKESITNIEDIFPSATAADLQNVFARLIDIYMKTNSCQTNQEVYDGKKHYQLISDDKGPEKRIFELKKREVTAHYCAIYVKNLKNNNDNILWELTADKPIKLWVARDETTKMPFVLEINIDSTPLGALKVTPTALEIK